MSVPNFLLKNIDDTKFGPDIGTSDSNNADILNIFGTPPALEPSAYLWFRVMGNLLIAVIR